MGAGPRHRRRALALVAAVLSLVFVAAAGAQRIQHRKAPVGRWYVVERDDGVVISAYERPDEVIPLMRGSGEIDAGLYTVAAVLRDADAHADWMAHTVASRLLERSGDFDFTFYQRLGAPWPVSHRDAVLAVRGRFEPKEGLLVTRFRNVEDPRVPPRKDVVRMPRLRGEYRLQALASDRTQVTLLIDADPGGALPDWLVKAVTRAMPRDMIVSLRDRVSAAGDRYDAQVAAWRARYGPVTPAGSRHSGASP
ncbi:MAG: START domain-containing protein [Myxococcales bacterium]